MLLRSITSSAERKLKTTCVCKTHSNALNATKSMTANFSVKVPVNLTRSLTTAATSKHVSTLKSPSTSVKKVMLH